jgi:hypothetical protein
MISLDSCHADISPFTEGVLSRWAKSIGVDTGLFETKEEWELLAAIARLHCEEGRW